MRHPLFACTALLLTTAANAQAIKPGLWEITHQMQGAAGSKADAAMAQMQKQLASMSPEQRKMVEEMMAMKVCLTPEMAARNEVAPAQQGRCTHTPSPRSGNTQKFAFTCTTPPSRGEGQVTYTSPEAYTMTMHTTTTVKGQEETLDMQAQGKWLGGDCGNVKPALPRGSEK